MLHDVFFHGLYETKTKFFKLKFLIRRFTISNANYLFKYHGILIVFLIFSDNDFDSDKYRMKFDLWNTHIYLSGKIKRWSTLEKYNNCFYRITLLLVKTFLDTFLVKIIAIWVFSGQIAKSQKVALLK